MLPIVSQKTNGDGNNVSARDLTIINNNYSFDKEELKTVGLSLMHEFVKIYTDEALATVNSRINKFMDELLICLQIHDKRYLREFRETDFQYILFEAEKGYVREGQEHHLNALIYLIVERVVYKDYDDVQILDEAIIAVSHLSKEKLQILSICYYFNNLEDIKKKKTSHMIEWLEEDCKILFNDDIVIQDFKMLDYFKCGKYNSIGRSQYNCTGLMNVILNLSNAPANMDVLMKNNSFLMEVTRKWDNYYGLFDLSLVGDKLGEYYWNNVLNKSEVKSEL